MHKMQLGGDCVASRDIPFIRKIYIVHWFIDCSSYTTVMCKLGRWRGLTLVYQARLSLTLQNSERWSSLID